MPAVWLTRDGPDAPTVWCDRGRRGAQLIANVSQLCKRRCPPMNDQLKARLGGIRQILMAHSSAGSPLPTASKGSERETLVREFLERVFPLPYRFGSGAITDGAGLVSGQL